MKERLKAITAAAVAATFGATLGLSAAALAQSTGGEGGTVPMTAPSPLPTSPGLGQMDTKKKISLPTSGAPASQIQGTTAGTAVDIASSTNGFGTFGQAIDAVGLLDQLRGPGPYTIFVPSDAAFSRMSQGPLDALLATSNRSWLHQVLAYHVVPGVVMMSAIRDQQSFPTLLGDPVVVKKTATGAYTVNGANIVERDVQAGNGEIQVIDSVLIPNRRTPADSSKNSAQ